MDLLLKLPEWLPMILFFAIVLFLLISTIVKFIRGFKLSKEAKEFRKNLKNNDSALLYPHQYSTFTCIVGNVQDKTVDITIKNVSKDFLYHK